MCVMPSALVMVGTVVWTGLAVGVGLAAVMLRIHARLKRHIDQDRANRRAAATLQNPANGFVVGPARVPGEVLNWRSRVPAGTVRGRLP